MDVEMMEWKHVFDPATIQKVISTPVRGVRVTMLASPGNAINAEALLIVPGYKSPAHFLSSLARCGGGARYELRIHKYSKPYVSVFEQRTKKLKGLFYWPYDTEPLTARDPRMEALSCYLEEYFQNEIFRESQSKKRKRKKD